MTESFYTIGHSTRSIEEFVVALEAHGVKAIADVRLHPGSKRYPHFTREALVGSLQENAIQYQHFPELGGRRKPRSDSVNSAWRNEAFRGYADYMETEDFDRGITRLLRTNQTSGPTALMCAEALWWRCHRALIADYLKMSGVDVIHIVDAKKSEPHPFTSPAQVIDGRLSYALLV